MSEKSDLKEALRALTEDVAEAVAYLRELGVEGLEGAACPVASSPAEPFRETTTREAAPRVRAPERPAAALARNASV
ncbi:MAG: hypothetical protein ACRD68_09110, partial [Pyrinomonadaceae bacterium]